MAELCPSPRPKNDPPLFSDQGDAMQRAPSRSSGGLTVAWLATTTMMAVAGLIMAAWATWKVGQIPGPTSQVLVSSPAEAASRGYSTVGNVYRGTGYWSLNARSMEFRRSDHAVVAYNGSIYVLGGQSQAPTNSSEAILLANMTRYNMYLGTVEELQPMPEARYRFGYAVDKEAGKLYVFGGFNKIDGDTVDQPTTTMIFDFHTRTWNPLDNNSPRMNVPRADLGGAIADGKIYAAGGYNISNNYGPSAVVEVLDPTSGRWKRVADMTMPRGDFRIAAVRGEIFALGGVTTIGDGSCPDWTSCHPWTSTIEVYNAKTNTWTPRASMNNARGDFAVEVLYNGNILVAGGETNFTQGTNTELYLNQVAMPWVEEYITTMDYWVPKAALFQPRFRFDMASDDGQFVYAFGGAPTCAGSTCNVQALNTILGFYDDQYPNIWVAKT